MLCLQVIINCVYGIALGMVDDIGWLLQVSSVLMKVDEGGAFFFLTVLLKVSLCSQRLFIWK